MLRRDPDLLERLAADLAELDFTVAGTEALLGPVASAALHREVSLPARRRLAAAEGVPVSVPMLLFTMGSPMAEAAVDRAFRRTGSRGLVALGLADCAAGEVRARHDLRPYGDEDHTWWLASDFGETVTGGPLPPDHVLGVGAASATLASWTPRPQVARALDLGTGCGVQALHLAAHAAHIVATDVSARALEVAAFNAALAGQVWDLRRGSLFEPVAGQRYDLIVSNPPFVITPRSAGVPTYEYRDGGLPGDALVEALVRGAAAHLTPGGIAHFLGNWEIEADGHWRSRWSQWLDRTGLDAYVVQREVADPAEYAHTWVRDGGQLPGTSGYDALLGAWLDDFEARGVAGIGMGVVTLRRPVAEGRRAPFVDLVEHQGPVAAPMGPAVLAALSARTWLADHEPQEILARAWAVAPDVIEERHAPPGADDPSLILLRQGGGLGLVVRADTALSAFVSVCDGRLAAGRALGAIAGLLERPVAEVVAEVLPQLKGLIADGFLLPA